MGKSNAQLDFENTLLLARYWQQQNAIERCQDNLRAFVKEAWPVVEPGVPYVHGWHIDAICDHLSAVATGDIRKLLINIPPRCAKSTLCAILFPAWIWIKSPERRFLFSSYDLKLSMRDSRKCRSLLGSTWYQRPWANKFKILTNKGGQDTKQRFDNDKGGYRIATATDVGTTGDGGDCLEGSVRVMTNFGEIPIREIVEKRLPVKVLGSSGRFLDIQYYNRRKGTDLIEFEMETGEKFACTDNHPIFTESLGYIAAKEVIQSTYGDLHLRRLPSFLREAGGTCGPIKTRAILLAGLLRKILQRIAEPGLRRRFDFSDLQAVWEEFSIEAFGGYPALAMPGLPHYTYNNTVPVSLLQKELSPKQSKASLLFDWLCAETDPIWKSEWAIQTRKIRREIWSRVYEGASRRDQDPGRLHLRAMQQGDDSAACSERPDRGASLGWRESEPFAYKSSLALQAVSSENSSEEWAESRVDERVRIKTFRRCPPPDYVYNLQVAEDHDYYANGVLTHNCIIYDDANDVRQMTSEAYIESVIYFHEHVMASRLNDPKTGCRVSIQQRSHERDITGHILETEQGWEHLVIPMEFEGSTKVTSIGWSDPRTNVGDLMWPEHIGPTEVETFKKNAIVWAGQYQQHPSPGEGAMFKREYWNFWNPPTAPRLADGSFAPVVIRAPGQPVIETIPVEIPPAFEQVVQSWDMAFKDEADNDLVAGHAWGRVAANTYLIDRESDRWDFVKTLAAVRRLTVRYPCPEKLVEDKANGPAVISTLRNEIPGLIPIDPDGNKVSRANAVSPYCQSGNVYLPNPNLYPWVWEFIEQCANFPRGRHDDDVDAMTQALRRLYDAVANGSMPEFRVIPRKGEPATACHVKPDAELLAECPPHWRRWIAVSPGAQGAALWVCETPKGSLRVYRELDISGIDAHEAGRRIAEATLPDIRAFMSAVHATAKWNIDLLLEKEAFTPIEPIGSLAELLEMGLLSYEQTSGTFEEREAITAELRLAKFSAQMAEIEDGSIDRLRDLLRFKPVDFEELSYDRAKAISLARTDQAAYARFMAAIDGQVTGEFPKIRFAASCLHTIASVGAAKRDEEITDAFLRALVIGISAPPSVMTAKPMKEIPWHGNLRSRKPLGLLRRAG